jgi:two-component system NarL family response regulator
MRATQSERRIRVVVADDHDLFRTGVAAVLEEQPDIEVVAQASGGRMAVRLAAELQPDVVVIDLMMPDLDGHTALAQIVEANPSTRVVVLTISGEDGDVAAAIEAGAWGFLGKDASLDSIAVAVRAAAAGAAWLGPRAAEVVLDQARRQSITDAAGDSDGVALSEREIEVLRLVARGLENNEIAEALFISPQTAKNHVSRILRKLGVQSRVQAAVYAVRRGII